MSVYRKHGKPEYHYDFIFHGRRFSGATGTSNKRQAERVLDEKRREARERSKQAASFTAEGPMSLEIASSRFWHEVGQHLANSDSYFRFLGWLLEHFGKNTTLDRISDSKIAAMVSERRADGVTNATVNRTATVPLRGIMTRAKKTWKVPVADIDWSRHLLREPKERVREASFDEEKRLLAAMRDDYAPAVRFAILTGCRRMEIVDLTWSRVDFFGKTMTVVGKGNKTRILPMTDAVRDLLLPLRDNHSTAVFTYKAKRTSKQLGLVRGTRYPITMEGFKTAWRRYSAKSGVENFRFHDTRHTAATRTLRAGNMKVVQRMLGHEDITTTAKYAHAMIEDMRVAMETANHTGSHTGAEQDASKDLEDKKKSA
ncbi:tyrosine-type recombinase/integrase [Mesorhizobium sp. ES1-3]|uniref:tyrosine-type recombinase/integrase n=1 Tax=Mesorhizobium sp. ES1-3 TaxID=2876628 RepID=UPI001CCB1D06|nr:site-specific integrase [Mesorhizobium sp. ES1-3]MBZ9670943.1 site-specific integrase [Mesorhizobium sp. ES1-3]